MILLFINLTHSVSSVCSVVIFPPQRPRRSQRLKIILSFIEHTYMHPMAKIILLFINFTRSACAVCSVVIFPPQRPRRSQRLKIILFFIEDRVVNIFLTMHPMAKIILLFINFTRSAYFVCSVVIFPPQRPRRSQRRKIILSFIEHTYMHPMAKNDPFIHKLYTLCVLCVLRGDLSTTETTEITETKGNFIFH